MHSNGGLLCAGGHKRGRLTEGRRHVFSRTRLLCAVLLGALVVAALASSGVAATGSSAASAAPEFLTGPNAGQPLDIALGYFKQHLGTYGLGAADVGDVVATRIYSDRDTGATHVFLQQRYKGIDVYLAIANAAVMPDGTLVNLNSRFVGGLGGKVNTGQPAISRTDAAAAAASALGLSGTAGFRVLRDQGGVSQAAELSTGGVSLATIPVKLMYQATANGVRLAWNLEIQQLGAQHWWNVRVDAVTGKLLSTSDYVDNESFVSPAKVKDGSSYQVYALPKENPNSGPRTVEKQPADKTASKFGCHDTNGAKGPEFTKPQGNNVHAYIDADNNNLPDAGEPDVGNGLDFKFPLDLTKEPATYKPAAATNLFYWNNIIHDLDYLYGFDEASANFQENNYGHGGSGSDSVNAEAQDGGGINNANFFTPADGQNPRMQMYL